MCYFNWFNLFSKYLRSLIIGVTKDINFFCSSFLTSAARDRIKSIFPQLEREFDGLNQDADSRYNNQKTIKDLGAAADLGGLDELTGGSGIGAATGEIFGLIAQGTRR